MNCRISHFLILFLGFNVLLFSAVISDFFTGKLVWNRIISDYIHTQYFASYHLEFLKRGVVATIFQFFSIAATKLNIFVLNVILANLLFLVVWHLSKTVFMNINQKVWLIFMWVFIVSPATAVQFGNDFGRFDPLNMLIMVVSVWIILNYKAIVINWAIPVLSGMAILIHEIYIFTGLPIVLATMYLRSQHVMLYLAFSSLGVVVFVVVLSLFVFGKADDISTINHLVSRAGKGADEFPVAVWTSSVFQNIEFTFERYLQFKTWTGIIRDMIILLPYLLLIWFVLRDVSQKRRFALILVSPFAVLPLFVLGIDFSRWVSMIVFNALIVLLIVLHYLNGEKKEIAVPKLLWFLLVALGLSGPLGVT
ncbi:MAG: hypothetical protein IE931_14935 [Sphingobacteriales bacterium]|nr:hypothetical protein [Sphingobacteriales bacterium]MBD3822038.1 hypothetical protein [Thiotrichales bacterium]